MLQKSVDSSVKNSMTEVKPVAMEKHDVEHREERLLVEPFVIFGFS